jgi:cytochrome c oxidase accessory protein FixG
MNDYRDKVGTIDDRGKRIWIYAKKPFGKFFNYRQAVGYSLILILIITPFINVNGNPLLLFNILEGRFIIFSIIFTTQDMHLFAIMMLTMMVFVVLFTVIFGRLFCGWVCPQTVFMELIFRRIEYAIEGDYNQQKKLNKAEWTIEKLAKKILKHGIFFLISFCIGNLFLSYIIGVEQVQKIITDPISVHIQGLIAMVIFSSLFYGVFAFFREQVCVAVCPYGRLQSVLLDSNSMVVIYDWIRGEPRGKKVRNDFTKKTEIAAVPKGDCVDCNLCVKVCPTGIDIRNGTQMECVNCTACMDACNDVMSKIGRDTGLIRIDSSDNIEHGKSKLLTKRVMAYCGVLIALISLQSFLLYNRGDVELIVQRTPGILFQQNENGTISNLYNYQIINKTTEDIDGLSLSVDGETAELKPVGGESTFTSHLAARGSFFIIIPKDKIRGSKNNIKIKLTQGEKVLDEINTNFLGPIKKN